MGSRIGKLAGFLEKIGAVKEPIFQTADLTYLDQLEAIGALESPEEIARYLTIPALKDQDYIRRPVDPNTFLNDSYYVGEFAKPGRGLFPKLKEDFCDVFDPQNMKSEVVLTGSIGWGKSYFGGWCNFYVIYLLSCLRNPHKFCGIEEGTPIVLLNLSVTGKAAANTIFVTVKNLVDSSPYFRDHFPRDKKLSSVLRFTIRNPSDPSLVSEIHYQSGNSSEFSAIGQNVISGVIDEANFMVSAHKAAHEKLQGDVEHAMVLYRALTRRTMSRFMFSRGFRGFIILASSVMYEDDFIQQHIKKVESRPDVKILSYSHWDVRDPSQYSGETFGVALGSAVAQSKIVAEGDTVASGVEIVNVPVAYRQAFEADLDGSIRDIMGRPVLAINPFMDRAAVFRQEVTEFDGYPLVHPFIEDNPRGIDLGSLELQYDRIREVLCRPHLVVEGRRKTTIFKPARQPDKARFIHVDLSLSEDAAGFGMGFPAGIREVERSIIDPNGDLVQVVERVPVIVFEILVSFVAPVGGTIDYAMIRSFIYWLSGPCNFKIAGISFDQFQSADSKQILRQHGYEVYDRSVDRELAPYEQLRNGIAEGWIFFYKQSTAHRELIKLQRLVTRGQSRKIKVDHPSKDSDNPRGKGSKDVSDCMAGVVADIFETTPIDSDLDAIRPMSSEASDAPPPSAYEWQNPDDNWILPDDARPT